MDTTDQGQRELRRLRYLRAMGVHSHLSRYALPAAAPSRHLVLVPKTSPPALSQPAPSQPAASRSAAHLRPVMPEIGDPPVRSATRAPARGEPPVQVMERFNLAVILCAGILWVEDLEQRPMGSDQTRLVAAMGRALAGEDVRAEFHQFRWPMNDSRQLDHGPEAAAAALGGFLARQLEQGQCRAMVLLGEGAVARVPAAITRDRHCVRTRSSLAMLADPALKRLAWADLQALVRRG